MPQGKDARTTDAGNGIATAVPGARHPETLTLRDQLLGTLAWLRLALPAPGAMALLYGVHRSTISTAR